MAKKTASTVEVAVARRDDVAVKIDEAVVRMAKSVAGFRGQSLAEYLSTLLEPLVRADFVGMVEGQRDAPAPKRPRKGGS